MGGGGEERRGLFHTQRAPIARLQSQEIWTGKSKQFRLAGAWSAWRALGKLQLCLAHRQPASNKWRVNQLFHSAEGEAPSEAVALASPQAGFSSFSLHSRCFMSLGSFPHEIKGQLPNIKGSINPSCKRRLQFSKSYHHLEQKHCRGPFTSNNYDFPLFRMACIAFPVLTIFSTVLYSLCPQRIKPDFHLFCLSIRPQVKSALW